MSIKPYRETLSLPGVRALLLVTLFARIPATAAGVTLTLHVVEDLGRGYAAAGLVGAAVTIGTAVGSPLLGRLTDRYGLRLVLAATTVVEAAFWATAQAMPYVLLVALAFVGGLFQLPVFSVARQSIAALVPEDRRRPAYALDAMSVELSFMLGPALAVFLATAVSARAAMLAIGGGIVLGGIALLVLNPPIRASHEERPTVKIPRRQWVTPRLLMILAITMATTVILGGSDVAVVAAMRAAGEVPMTGAVIAAWCAFSLLGGFAYGMVRRPVAPQLLLLLLAVFTIPVGLGNGTWWLLALSLIPAGLLCAPTLTATADAVSRLAPPSVRGEATGLHGSALTIGIATGAPLAGWVMDTTAPAWGFAATGGLGLLIVLICLPIALRHRRDDDTPTPDPLTAPTPAAEPSPAAAART
ncbi:MFS transporter [Spirilliplanes yamanashiensis]|uniref:MFS transporter n=1 Tax=Spirilliplanes yamanashiensis TaxID=42233 RepID=A0A8J4DM02_9ACTN|nr:MFS transporter [Spirilliplanes yamanashiensis]MDP9816232.1 putative MFS family arabinose efflux permease [Spirilliplanes yamanashiensis]GIJ05759.1 MFS transporter [Spirilliplanes yamanashiensis]